MRVREATPADLAAVMGVLDGAMLAADAATVRDRAAAGDVLVAVAGGGGAGEGGAGDAGGSDDGPRGERDAERVLGACVLDVGEADEGAHVDAVAVRRRRRGQGIGTALLERALAREGRLTADFDAAVRPFYDALGFDVRETDDGRYRGVREDA